MGGLGKAERETIFILPWDLRIRFRRSEAPPPYRYAITVEVREDEEWMTIRLWDNAHGVDLHHEHAYTRREGKQPPILHSFGSPNQAIPAALDMAKTNPRRMVRQWRSS
jgi:hypothetical protein